MAGHRQRRADDARVSAEGRRARALGRHPPRPRRGAGRARRRRRRRARPPRRDRSPSASPTSPRSGGASTRPASARASTAGSSAFARRAGWASRRPASQHDLAPLLATMRVRKDARRNRDHAPRGDDQRRRACPRDALLRGALRRGSARGHPRVRDRGRAAARVPPLGRRGAGLHLDRRRRRERLHPPLHAERDAVEGGRALPDRRRLRARRLCERRDAHLPRRRPLQRRRSASSTTSSRRRRPPPSRRRSRARACATPMPPRCASSPKACSTSACSIATPSATSTR